MIHYINPFSFPESIKMLDSTDSESPAGMLYFELIYLRYNENQQIANI